MGILYETRIYRERSRWPRKGEKKRRIGKKEGGKERERERERYTRTMYALRIWPLK